MNFLRILSALVIACVAMPALADPPSLRRQGDATQLVVNGAPILLIGGELGNSSASSAAYMAPIWPRLRAMHLNAVFAPVTWELIEPEEGRFDWSSVDRLISDARANDMKLVILWFGAWKNSMSTYAPAWVKRDQARFPRAQTPNGQGVDILSAFGAQTQAADGRAFAALLRHIRSVDDAQNTVVMVQIENEIGMLPVAREYGPLAEAAFRQPVPRELVDYLVAHRASLVPRCSKCGSSAAPGRRAPGRNCSALAPGGGGLHRLALCPLRQCARRSGQGRICDADVRQRRAQPARPGARRISSGGPLPHLIDVWKAGAPAIDFLAPDIYFPNFVDIAARYTRPDNPLFIPEALYASNPQAPANALFAFGEHDAIGYGPFSIESVSEEARLRSPAPTRSCTSSAVTSSRRRAATGSPASSRGCSTTRP
jgi:beta-galactosidase GanA